MGKLTRQLPKPMIPLMGRPILEHQIDLAARYHCRDIIMLTGYMGEKIENYFGDGTERRVNIRYQHENAPLGTAGAIKSVEDWLRGDFLVFYGDTIMDLDLKSLMTFHAEKGPLATLVTHPNSHPHDSDLLEVGEDSRVIAFWPKPRDPSRYYRNMANAALCILSPQVLRYIPKGQFSDLGRDIFPKVVVSGGAIFAYNTPEYIADVGTPDRLRKAEADLASGKVARLNRRNARKAVFLDRDGTLNVEVGHVRAPEQLHLLPGVTEAIRLINQSEYLCVVVTNQPAIAKGFVTEQELNRIHAKLETLLGAEHAYLDRIYYCPHHPEKGFPGERPEYKIPCACRKPAPGMVLRAASELNVDLSRSFIVGDRTADIRTGANAGVKTILLRTGYAGQDAEYSCRPDFVFEDLTQTANFVVNQYNHP